MTDCTVTVCAAPRRRCTPGRRTRWQSRRCGRAPAARTPPRPPRPWTTAATCTASPQVPSPAAAKWPSTDALRPDGARCGLAQLRLEDAEASAARCHHFAERLKPASGHGGRAGRRSAAAVSHHLTRPAAGTFTDALTDTRAWPCRRGAGGVPAAGGAALPGGGPRGARAVRRRRRRLRVRSVAAARRRRRRWCGFARHRRWHQPPRGAGGPPRSGDGAGADDRWPAAGLRCDSAQRAEMSVGCTRLVAHCMTAAAATHLAAVCSREAMLTQTQLQQGLHMLQVRPLHWQQLRMHLDGSVPRAKSDRLGGWQSAGVGHADGGGCGC